MNEVLFFEKDMKHKFSKPEILSTALTHTSFANENLNGKGNNERMEFLGDAVLDLIVGEYLFSNYSLSEGYLSRTRASIVCEKSLAKAARELGLGKFLRLGRGEEKSGGRDRDSVLSDAFEAVIAALYLDAGITKTAEWVINKLQDIIDEETRSDIHHDFKTALQEKVQKRDITDIHYEVVGEDGPDHDKRFEVIVVADGKILGRGCGKSKKKAEQEAAKAALKNE